MSSKMNYFECEKCGVSLIHKGDSIPFFCGVFVGVKNIIPPGCHYEKEFPECCGGKIVKISKDAAMNKVNKMRGE